MIFQIQCQKIQNKKKDLIMRSQIFREGGDGGEGGEALNELYESTPATRKTLSPSK